MTQYIRRDAGRIRPGSPASARTVLLLGTLVLLLVPAACDMLSGPNGDDGPSGTPTFDRFEIAIYYPQSVHNRVDLQTHPNVEIHYRQNDWPQVILERAAPDDDHPGFAWAGHKWHGGHFTDEGDGLPDNRLRWGHTYVYRMQGLDLEGVRGGFSDEYEYTLPDFHPPENVSVAYEHQDIHGDLGNLVTWDRIAVDRQDGKVKYHVYGKSDYSSLQRRTTQSGISGTEYFHFDGHFGGDYDFYQWEYRVRAQHDDYGWTLGSEPADSDTGTGPSPPEGIAGYTRTHIAGFRLEGDRVIQALERSVSAGTLYLAAADEATNSPVVKRLSDANGPLDCFGAPDNDDASGPYGWTRLAAGTVGDGQGDEKVYLALRDGQNIYLHEYDVAEEEWSDVSVQVDDTDNFGLEGRPSDVGLAVHDGELYAAVISSGGVDLRVKRLHDGTWEKVGSVFGTGTSSTLRDSALTVLDEDLYFSWTEGGDRLRVRRLNGETWDSYLDWDGNVSDRPELAKQGGELVFMAPGSGVFRRTGVNSAEDLGPGGADWSFGGLYSMTADESDNIIVAGRNLEDLSNQHPMLLIYDGSEWKQLAESEEFSQSNWPVVAGALGDQIIYAAGSGATHPDNAQQVDVERFSP